MISLKFISGSRRFDDPEARNTKPSLIRASDMVDEIYEFMNKYFRGSFKNKIRVSSRRVISFTESDFADFIKIIFKAVFGEEPIYINAKEEADELVLSFGFDLKRIDEKTMLELDSIARKSGFVLKATERHILACFPYSSVDSIPLMSISTRIVYNSLVKTFRS